MGADFAVGGRGFRQCTWWEHPVLHDWVRVREPAFSESASNEVGSVFSVSPSYTFTNGLSELFTNLRDKHNFSISIKSGLHDFWENREAP